MTPLSLNVASAVIDEALAEGARRGSKPLAIAVLDLGGHPLAVKREETASYYRATIAIAKAHGALGMGVGSRTLADRARASPGFYAALGSLTGGQCIPAPGGVLILSAGGQLLGAVGVSGDTPDMDEACAIAGIEAVSLCFDAG